jgi:asparaginyl-tRNA synthetase
LTEIREETPHRDELPEGHQIKAFYMRVNDDGWTVAAIDVLAPGIGEIIGSSQREERLDVLDARMAECHIDREHYAW